LLSIDGDADAAMVAIVHKKLSFCRGTVRYSLDIIQGGPEKNAQSLQHQNIATMCVIASHGFRLNFQKLINKMKTEKISILHLNVLCLVASK